MSFQTKQNYPLVILCSINPCIMIPRVEYCKSKVLTLKSWGGGRWWRYVVAGGGSRPTHRALLFTVTG